MIIEAAVQEDVDDDFGGRRHRFRCGYGQVFKHRRKRHGHVHGAHAFDRSVQVIESAVGDDRGDLPRHAVTLVAFIDDDGATRLFGGIDQRLFIKRESGSWVDDFRADVLGRQSAA